MTRYECNTVPLAIFPQFPPSTCHCVEFRTPTNWVVHDLFSSEQPGLCVTVPMHSKQMMAWSLLTTQVWLSPSVLEARSVIPSKDGFSPRGVRIIRSQSSYQYLQAVMSGLKMFLNLET